MPAQRRRTVLAAMGLLALSGVVAPFAIYSFTFGSDGFLGLLPEDSRFWSPGTSAAHGFLFAHMICGGMLTVLVPLQLWSIPRRHAPRLHHASGYLLLALAGITGLAVWPTSCCTAPLAGSG